ncbi:MAG: choice-of-anchor Q domain-containing protein [Dokdonella sp.]
MTHRYFPKFLVVGLSLGLLLAGGPTARAATICVHDVDELGNAILNAEANGEGNEIQIATGSYVLGSQINYQSTGVSLTLTGGWNTACTQRTINALNTVIDGNNAHFLFFYAKGSALSLDGIRFDHVPIQQMSSETTTVRHSMFTGSIGTDVMQIESSSGTVVFESDVFDRRNVEIRSLDGTDASPITWTVSNSTFLDAAIGTSNQFVRMGYGLYLNEPGTGSSLHIFLANNAFWGNAGGGIRVNSSPELLATHNHWQSLTNVNNVALVNGSGANSGANPQLDANYQPIIPGSPVINSGTVSFPGGIGATDLGGGPRLVGSAPDRGAYESVADDSATLVVTTNADSGAGSLRAALVAAAAAPNAQRIAFALPSCPLGINVSSALPTIIDTLTIDGYSQVGAVANTLGVGSNARLCVILIGNYPGSVGLVANNPNSHLRVRGLAFSSFGDAAIAISDGFSHIIEGNQFGGAIAVGVSGSIGLSPNARGVRLQQDSSDSFVGGIDPQQRNVFDASSVYGIGLIGNSGGHEVRNNYVGLAPDGSHAFGNAVGVVVASANNLLDRNVIGANVYEGVQLQGNPIFQGYPQGNALTRNLIGLPALQGLDSAQNYGAGVRVTANANGNLIGVDAQGQIAGNVIVGNGENGVGGPGNGNGGVSVESGVGNRISGNIIRANYGLAIDLGADGPTANDPTDSDTGPNQLQNFPTLNSIHYRNGARLLGGSLYLSSSTRVEIFASAECGNAGRADAAVILSAGARSIIAPIGGGNANFTSNIGRGPGSGVDTYCQLGATATDADGNTSEISPCFVDDTLFAHDFDTPTSYRCVP